MKIFVPTRFEVPESFLNSQGNFRPLKNESASGLK